MGHMKDILTRCDNDTELAEVAMKIEIMLADSDKRRDVAVWLAKESQSFTNSIKKGETNYEQQNK